MPSFDGGETFLWGVPKVHLLLRTSAVFPTAWRLCLRRSDLVFADC